MMISNNIAYRQQCISFSMSAKGVESFDRQLKEGMSLWRARQQFERGNIDVTAEEIKQPPLSITIVMRKAQEIFKGAKQGWDDLVSQIADKK